MDGWTVVIQVNSLVIQENRAAASVLNVSAVLMRTNPIRPQDHRSEPNHPRPISEPIFLNLSAPNVSTGGSAVTARSAEGRASVSTDGSAENAASAEGQPSVSTGGGASGARSAMRTRMVVVLCLTRSIVCRAKWLPAVTASK